MSIGKACVTALSLFIASPMPVFAEEAFDADALLDMSLADLLDMTVVSSASKYTQKTAEAPASVSVFTADDIRRYGYRTLADLLTGVRGLYKASDSAYQYLGIRGFSRPGDYGTRLLLMIDGHKVNENIFGSASVNSAFNLDMDLIQRVEIVHGPSSSLYGAGAFLAVINIFTKSGATLDGAEISAGLADHEQYNARAAYGRQLENGLEFLVSASLSDYPGRDIYIPYFNNPDYGDGNSRQWDHEDVERLFAKLRYQDFTLTASYAGWQKGMTVPYYGQVFDDPPEAKEMRAYLDLVYHRGLAEDVETRVRLSYNLTRFDGHYYYDLGAAEGGYLLNRDEHTGRWWNGEWQLQWQWGGHRLISGVEYQANIAQEMRNYDQSPEFYELAFIEVDDNYWAVYLQDEIPLNEQLTLNAGIRHDHYDALGGTTHPRVALIYRPRPATSLKLLAGSAFRSPSTYEMYFDDGFYLKRSPGMEAETIQAYEAALEHRFGEHTQGIVSLYHYKVENLIENSYDPDDGLIFYHNAGTAKTHGLEAELRKRWDNGMEGRLGYAWQEAENADTGERLSGLPRHLLKLRGSLPLGDAWRAALEVRYTAAMDTYYEPHETLSSYTLTDFTLSGELVKGLWLTASVYNLFDTEYAYPLSDEFEPDRFPGEERNFRVKLDYRF